MNKVEIFRKFDFEAAHNLPDYDGKCQSLHGHSYKLKVGVVAEVDESGIGIDASKIKDVVESEAIQKLDHKNLNEVIKNPTMENILLWVYRQIKVKLPVSSIEIRETERNSAKLTISETHGR
jgi:6-pyruvoyltetrahydropterin/6-carboxytetrahydropterin synthase